MRNKNKFLLAILSISILSMYSCKKDFLNLTPLGEISSDATWKDGPLSAAFVTNIYNGFGPGGFDEQMLAALSDEAVFTHTGRGITTINDGSLSPSNTGWSSGTYEWGSMYTRIRACNLALQNLETATFDDNVLKERLKGEAHFLRAYFYHQLVRYYGGVPLITKTYGLNEDYTIERSSFENCVKLIAADCDTASQYLNGKSLGLGRATSLAAMALKSRILVYAASDLHDIPTAKAKSATISAFANPELLGYTSGDRNSRWQAAKTAAKLVMDASSGYMLDLAAPVSLEQGKANYISISMGGGSSAAGVDKSASKEIILGRYNTSDQDDWGGPYVGLFNGPNGYHNWAGNTPIGLLVDDYEMMDKNATNQDTSVAFSWANPQHKADPYKNRDPRFYASILYDGAPWKPRDLPSPGADPYNLIQTGKYDLMVKNKDGVYEFVNFQGLDTRSSSIEDWNGSRSGYYMRKFIDPNPAIIENNTRQYVPWPFFRYTEAVFNYIESCIELGQDEEARNWLNKIRFRAGMPAVLESGSALRDRYRHERRIEMSFEEQRYHDARRWMIAPTTLGRKLDFIGVTAKFKPGKDLKDKYKYDQTIYDYTYTPFIELSHENRTWVDKMYFRPISRDEVNTNNKLVQNPGYQ